VYDLWYKLRPFVDERRIGRGDFGRVDRVGSAIFDQEGEEGEDGADEEEDDYKVEDEEYCEAATHGFNSVRVRDFEGREASQEVESGRMIEEKY